MLNGRSAFHDTKHVYMLRRDWLLPLAITLSLFFLYGLTAPRTVAFEDDGLFIMSAWYNGIAHPPGYPLYTLLAHPFSHIPLGTVAWRVHLLSGLFAALACSLLWLLNRQLGLGRMSATIASLGYGVSQVFWSQAIIAEVYTLHVFITFALMNALVVWRRKALAGQNCQPISILTAFLFGLGLSNHWPTLVLTSPAFLLMIWPAISRRPIVVIKLLPWVLLGLLPYGVMVLNSLHDPVISFLGPIDSWQRFVDYVMRRHYSHVDNSITAGWQDKLQFVVFFLRETSLQFGPVGFVLLATGIYDRVRAFVSSPSTIPLALFLGAIGTSFILLIFLNFDYDPFHKALFRVYPITAYGFLAIFLGFGVQRTINWIKDHNKKTLGYIALSVLAILLSLTINLPMNMRSNFGWADTYGRTLLQLPPNSSTLFVRTDYATFTLGYLHYIEGQRPDIKLMNSKGLVFPTRLYPAAYLSDKLQKLITAKYISTSGGPVYYEGDLEHQYAIENFCFLRRVDFSGAAPAERLILDPEVLNFMDWVLRQPKPNDAWASMLRHKLFTLIAYCLLNSREHFRDTEQKEWYAWATGILEKNFYVKLLEAEILLATQDKNRATDILDLLEKADRQKSDASEKQAIAAIYLLKGDAFKLVGNVEKAAELYSKAFMLWPNPNAEAKKRLDQLRAGKT